jgi:hypothetical protein
VLEWRRQSADIRARAEAGRAQWEERRARGREEKEKKQALQQRERQMQEIPRADTGVSAESPSISTSEWEAVSVGTTQQSASVLIPGPSTDASGGGERAPSSHSQEGPPTQVSFSILFLPSSSPFSC